MIILAKILSFFIQIRIALFKIGIFKTHKVNTKLISIGNLKIGGTGKTPFTIFLAKLLKSNDYKVGIIGKGYKRKTKGIVVYDKSKNLLPTANEIGDEMLLIAENTDCPVLVHNEKYLAAQEMEKLYDLDFIILDDGYQHLQLKRDLNILMVDDDTFLKNQLFPKGLLRERFENYDRADIICKIDTNNDFNFINKTEIKVQKKQGEIYDLFSNGNLDNSSEIIGFAVSGLANPSGFYKLLKNNKINIIEEISFADHYEYSIESINKITNKVIQKKANSLFTTEKDAIKLKAFKSIFQSEQIRVFVLPIEIELISGLGELLDKIKKL